MPLEGGGLDPGAIVGGKPNLQNVAGCAIHADIVRTEKQLISSWWKRHQQSLDDAIVKRLVGQTKCTSSSTSERPSVGLPQSGAFPRTVPKGTSPMFDPSYAGQHHISSASTSDYYSKTSAMNEDERYLPPTTWRFPKRRMPHYYGRTLHGVSADGTDNSYRAH
mmetsp:Transcript_5598/g.17451  ORF Transcript_5598/g.17451 Transcript_5598/m.17451 type:complete len:164 (+) Transcript_5598:35-526(+)